MATKNSSTSSYAVQSSRLTKDNLYMVIALYMEKFPVERVGVGPAYRKVGAVLVLPNDMIYAVDCSREGVHGVARLLMTHSDILKGCSIFVSRKPCSRCTKLLVQKQVKRVFYLPIEPEYMDVEFENETSWVDNLFKVSEIAQKVFVPNAGQDVFSHAEEKQQTPQMARKERKKELMDVYWNEKWMANASEKLPWPTFDENMKTQVKRDFESIMEWIARILIGSEKEYALKSSRNESMPFDPEENEFQRQQASHLITLAKFLSERTDDPRKGVGAVILKDKNIVALGWNGFPTKALYGEFPRASDRDKAVQDKKYPYVIHAEQNALMNRNTKNIEGGTLFVTKTPCNECTPMLAMQGIKTVVLGEKLQKETKPSLGYEEFCDRVKEGVFICFETKIAAATESGKPPPPEKQNIDTQ